MNYEYKVSRLLLASVLLVALVHAVPVLLRDEDDGQNVKQQELELYKNYSREDILIELLEIKKQFQLNVSNVEKTHTRIRRSSEPFQFPLDVCGTIPEYRGRIRGGSGGTRIVGGSKTGKGQIPWQVGLYKRRKERSGRGELFLMCGGALVTPHTAITASHCLKEDAVIKDVYQYQAWAGRTVSAKNKVKNEKRFIVLNYFKHPQFNEKTLQNDIAVLSLETEDKKPLAWTRWVRPVCLPEVYPRQKQLYKVGKEATVSGFGLLSERETTVSASLQHVKLDIVKLDDCMKAYEGTSAKVDKQNFCAARAGKDACTGDSGGPKVTQGADKRFYLIVVSFGKGCARKDYPGVYARVDKFIEWIHETVVEIESRHHSVTTESPTSTSCPTAQTCSPKQTCPTCKSCPSQTSPTRSTCPPRSTVVCPNCPPQRTCSSVSPATTRPPQTTPTTARPPWTRPTTRQPPTQPQNVEEVGPVCSRMSRQARCRTGYVIRVTEGYFGRHDDSDTTCPRQDSGFLWFQRSLGCFHTEATEVMARECNGRTWCYVSESFFRNSLNKMTCEARRPYAIMKFVCERSFWL